MTIENPSWLKESMTFSTERDLFDWYLKLLKIQKEVESGNHWSASIGTNGVSIKEISDYLHKINE